jgi:hypothetical protein
VKPGIGFLVTAQGKAMSYNVEKIHGCTMISGPVPVTDMVKLMAPPSDEHWILDPNLALKLGATLIFGPKDNLKRMAASAEVKARIHEHQSKLLDGVHVSDQAFAWLVGGERGKSSDSMFGFLTGVAAMRHGAHPVDAADFRRCRLLLEQVPEFNDRRQALTELSDVWGGLVAKWDDLCAMMDAEAPAWREKLGCASSTNQAIKQISTSRGQ